MLSGPRRCSSAVTSDFCYDAAGLVTLLFRDRRFHAQYRFLAEYSNTIGVAAADREIPQQRSQRGMDRTN
jgi:hypothetical protein